MTEWDSWHVFASSVSLLHGREPQSLRGSRQWALTLMCLGWMLEPDPLTVNVAWPPFSHQRSETNSTSPQHWCEDLLDTFVKRYLIWSLVCKIFMGYPLTLYPMVFDLQWLQLQPLTNSSIRVARTKEIMQQLDSRCFVEPSFEWKICMWHPYNECLICVCVLERWECIGGNGTELISSRLWFDLLSAWLAAYSCQFSPSYLGQEMKRKDL